MNRQNSRIRMRAERYVNERSLQVEQLEDRRMLAMIVGPLDFPSSGEVTAFVDGSLLRVVETGTITDLVAPQPLASVSNLQITGRDGADDTLTIDLTVPLDIPVNFDGGTGGFDSLVVDNGDVENGIVTFANASDGTVTLDELNITYAGLEPITISGTEIDDLVFNLPSSGSDVVLEDDGVGGNGVLRLTSVGGTAASIETVIFQNPSGSLTINRGNASDDLTVAVESSTITTYDLTSQWSDMVNPNGVWTYREEHNELPQESSWEPGSFTTPQPAWAESGTGNNRLPVWYKSNGTETFVHDWVAGDVIVHSTDPFNGVGNGPSNVVWTSPADGVVDISGGVWPGRDMGRSNDWRLYVNTTLVSSGSLTTGDPYNRANPFNLAAGSGGAAAVNNVAVNAGDTVRIEILRTSGAGDFVGVDFEVTLTQPPGSDFDATLIVGSVAAPLDEVTIADAVELSAGNTLSIYGQTIETRGAITAGGGNVVLSATGDISIGAGITTNGGALTLSADSDDSGAGTLTIAATTMTAFAQQAKLTAADGVGGDLFGDSVALSEDGNTAIVGASYDDIGGNSQQGSAYILVRNGNLWLQQAKLTASDAASDDYFGHSVALSDDGNTAIVGASSKDVGGNVNQGSTYVFVRNGNIWSQQTILAASDGGEHRNFGYSVALNSDGTSALIGASGAVYVFDRSGILWSEQAKLAKPIGVTSFGSSVSLSDDGTCALISASNTSMRSAFVFVRSGTVWTEQAQLTSSDGESNYFGSSVVLSGDGTTALVGAWFDNVGGNIGQGSAYVFVRNGEAWIEQDKLTAADGAMNDYFGWSVAVSDDGNTAVVSSLIDSIAGHFGQGSAYVFMRNGSVWTQQEKLTAADGANFEEFGYDVAVSGDGSTALIGAYIDEAGSAYIFAPGPPEAFTINTGAGDVTLSGADMRIEADVITTHWGNIQQTNGSAIDLGAMSDDAPNTLELSDTELDRISAVQINIGAGSGGGDIIVTADITRSTTTHIVLYSDNDLHFSSGSINTSNGSLLVVPEATSLISFENTGNDVTASIFTLLYADILITIDGTTADTSYDQLSVNGQVSLFGNDLVLSGSYTPAPGDSFVIVNNDGVDPITGTFAGLPDGHIIENFLGSTLSAEIDYQGGTGNDVEITVIGSLGGHWFYYPETGHYYGLTPDVGTWTQQETIAAGLGGHLASVTSQGEQQFLIDKFANQLTPAGALQPFWIGLRDVNLSPNSSNRNFRWTTGEPLSYTAWNSSPQEPNNNGGQEWYGAFNFHHALAGGLIGTWNDTYSGAGPLGVRTYRGIIELESPPLLGDFNLNGRVDGRDFLMWQRGQSFRPLSSADLIDWQQNYGNSTSDSLDSALQGYWQFDGNGGDSAGGDHPATLFGSAGYDTGLFGQSLSLNGNSANYAGRTVDDAEFDFGANDFTIQVWARFNSISTEQILVEKFAGATGPGWTLAKLVDNRWHFYSSPSGIITTVVQTIPINVWHQVIVQRMGTTFRLWYDGQIVGSVSDPDPIPNTTNGMYFGRRNPTGQNLPLNGRLDEVAIWDRALCEGEIALLWNSGAGREIEVPPGLAAIVADEKPLLVLALASTLAHKEDESMTVFENSYVENIDRAMEQLATVPSVARSFGEMVGRRGTAKRSDVGTLQHCLLK